MEPQCEPLFLDPEWEELGLGEYLASRGMGTEEAPGCPSVPEKQAGQAEPRWPGANAKGFAGQ